MRFEHDGISIWFGTSDAPAPKDVVADGSAVALTVAVHPADADNSVEIRYRINDGPTHVCPAKWVRTAAQRGPQYFRAEFPALRLGERVDYTPVCRCAGRQVPAPEAVGRLASSFRVGESIDPGKVTSSGAALDRSASSPRRYVAASRNPTAARGFATTATRPPLLVSARRRDDEDGEGPDFPDVEFAIHITSPANGAAVRHPGSVAVTGTTTKSSKVTITGLGVKLGSADFKKATPTGPNGSWASWSFSGIPPETGPLTITAQMSVKFPPNATSSDSDSVEVTVDGTPPTLTITGVTPGDAVQGPGPGFPVTVRGTAADVPSGVTTVTVSVAGESLVATSSDGWKHWERAITLHGEGSHAIVARATDKAGNSAEKSTAVTAIDNVAPVLQITQPVTLPTEVKQPLVDVFGSASDGTSVAWVKWQVDGGDLKAAENLSTDWSAWRALIAIPGVGKHKVRFFAEDSATTPNRTAPLEWTFTVAALGEVQGLSVSAYLRDLLNFAHLRVEKANGAKIDDAVLESAFHQPFGRLSDPAVTAAGTPVKQVRVSIEALRRYIDKVSGETGRRYRETAYYTMLSLLGTSYEEIRLVRAAEPDVRFRLATRLGFTLSARPNDELDQLLLTPEQLAKADSEDDLESLFGLIDTRRDPLVEGGQPKLLKWQKRYLRILWGQQDHPPEPENGESNTNASSRMPIVDPDIVEEGDLKGTADDNPAFELWTTRTALIAKALKDLRDHHSSSPPLKRFDDVVTSVLGTIDLEALAKDYNDGIDVGQTLDEYALSPPALTHLVSIRRLAATGTVLDTEWDAVFSILVQARKVRDRPTDPGSLSYREWREKERKIGLTLGPDFFGLTADTATSEEAATAGAGRRWRRSVQARLQWRETLSARIAEEQGVKESLAAAVTATEEAALPFLRDALIETVKLSEEQVDRSDWLSRRLQIDFETSGRPRTSRLQQAIDTVQSALFALRTGRLTDLEPLDGSLPFVGWHLTDDDGYTEQDFDEEWRWVGSYESWRAANFVFGYPENYVFPNLLSPTERTPAFGKLVEALRLNLRLTAADARTKALEYLAYAEEGGQSPFSQLSDLIQQVNQSLPEKDRIDVNVLRLTEQRPDTELKELRRSIHLLFEKGGFDPIQPPAYLSEICYFVPVLFAQQLQRATQYLAALDWLQCVYAYNFPRDQCKIYYGLVAEEELPAHFIRPPQWLLDGLNPHEISRRVSRRANVYTRFTVMALARCFLDFGDAEFTRTTPESLAQARTLYVAALDLLGEIETSVAFDEASLFPPNPLPDALRLHAETNLSKLRNGRNIAGLELGMSLSRTDVTGVPVVGGSGQILLPTPVNYRPTPYRYPVLIARAKELVGVAQQMESAYLAALEKRDVEAYSLLQARQHVQLAKATVNLQDLRLADARRGMTLARLQRERAEIQRDRYHDWIDGGLSWKEETAIALMGASAVLHAFSAVTSSWKFWEMEHTFGALAAAAASTSNVFSMWASFERREQEWKLQLSLAEKDVQIGDQQFALANDQVNIVREEREIATIEVDHAAAGADFLATKFTNVDLYDFMSGVLGRVYAYFLQQASATAALAETQLAFERQEAAPALIQADYWQPAESGAVSGGNGQSIDRKGLTGSARLLQDIYRLDQHAFETRRRLLQLSQTFSLASAVPFEFQRFRESGVLPFATPMAMFDRGFPGHYLRLTRRVRVSILALIPPVQGIRATLTASGISRVVIVDAFQETFEPIVVRRPAEQIAFTTPINASGLLELEPEGELLLPFEGMGVDTVWELALPKASNVFDYRTIADVLVTIEYTALQSQTYREQVIRQMDPRVSIDRVFSLHQDFPDTFYALANPPADQPAVARFESRRDYYPPNVSDLAIEHVVLYFVRREPEAVDPSSKGIEVGNLLFTSEPTDGTGPPVTVGGPAIATADGVISTRRGNGSTWKAMAGRSPVGSWTLELVDATASMVQSGDITDIVLVITYGGRTAPWPGQMPH